MEYSGLFQGPTKFGKTTFISKLPKTILVAFEQGFDAAVVDYIDCTGDDGWDKFIEFLDRLEENREVIGTNLKLLGIDTLEEAYRAAEIYMLKQYSIKDKQLYTAISDIPHGKGYDYKDRMFRAQIERIFNLGFKPLYLTHVEIKTIRERSGEQYEKIVPTVPARCAKIVMPEVSYIIHGDHEVFAGKRMRTFQVKSTDNFEAGGRVHIDGAIRFDTEDEAIEKFSEAWREAIRKRLIENGITENIDKIVETQEKEKKAKVDEIAAKIKSLGETVEEIKSIMRSKLESGTIGPDVIMRILNGHNLMQPDDIKDVDVAAQVLDELKAA